MATYPMHVAGLDRDFPICKVTDDLYIGAFIMFGDAELTVRCAEELLKLAEGIDYDYLFTAEAKSIPLIHEMARQSGAKKYFIARKGPKVYMPDPISVEDKSITTVAQQKLFLGSDDADLIRGKKILLVDDVISTGGSLKDYIYVNCFTETVPDPSRAAIRLSDRHFGIGGDGIILISPSDRADAHLQRRRQREVKRFNHRSAKRLSKSFL